MEKQVLTFSLDKETKNKFRYQETNGNGTLYVQKSLLGQKPPRQLTVTIGENELVDEDEGDIFDDAGAANGAKRKPGVNYGTDALPSTPGVTTKPRYDRGYPVDENRQCEATIRSGYRRCLKPAIVDSPFCAYHAGKDNRENLVLQGIEVRRRCEQAVYDQWRCQWELGNLALAVREQSLKEYAGRIGVEYDTLREYRRVAGAYQNSNRLENLSVFPDELEEEDESLAWPEDQEEAKNIFEEEEEDFFKSGPRDEEKLDELMVSGAAQVNYQNHQGQRQSQVPGGHSALDARQSVKQGLAGPNVGLQLTRDQKLYYRIGRWLAGKTTERVLRKLFM